MLLKEGETGVLCPCVSGQGSAVLSIRCVVAGRTHERDSKQTVKYRVVKVTVFLSVLFLIKFHRYDFESCLIPGFFSKDRFVYLLGT